MNFSSIRWWFVGGVVAAGLAGVGSSNVGCGSSSSSPDGGGGSSGSGGGAGTSSAHGGSGGAATPKVTYNFDTATSADSMGWKLNDYVDGNPAKNLGSYMIADAGLTLADPPTMAWASDDSEMSTSSGSMKISVTFTEFNQFVDPVINLSSLIDLSSSSSLTMKIRLVSGNFSTGGVQFHFSTTSSYTYSAGTWIDGMTLTTGLGQWKILNISPNIAQPSTAGAAWDPTMVIQFGVQITAGAPTDGGAPPSGRLVFEIDTLKG